MFHFYLAIYLIEEIASYYEYKFSSSSIIPNGDQETLGTLVPAS